MGSSRSFSSLPAAVKAFRIVYALLAANFIFPACVYFLSPATAIAQFDFLGRLLGGGPYPFSGGESGIVWRVLGAGNVMTLGFMCLLLLWDLSKYYPVLIPLVFLKACSVLGFLVAFARTHYPAFLAVSLFDGVTVWAMVFFARRAYAAGPS